MKMKLRRNWQELYYVMTQIAEFEPWNSITEDAVFCYCRKDGQEIFFRIIGEKYGYCGIACYIGRENYMRSKVAIMSYGNSRCELCLHDALIGLYDDREFVSKNDRELFDELGLKFRGRGAWLHFNSYRSGRTSAQLTDKEVELFADALGNLYMMLKAFFEGHIEIDFTKQALVRFYKKGGNFEWYNQVSKEAYLEYGSSNISLKIDNQELIRYFRSKKSVKTEAAIMLVPGDTVVTLDDGTKGYDAFLIIFDIAKRALLDVRCITYSVDMSKDIIDAICDVCEDYGKPKRFICDELLISAIADDFLTKIKSELVYMTSEEIDEKYGDSFKLDDLFDERSDDFSFDSPNITMSQHEKTDAADIPDNTYVISVSVGKGCYRHIAVSGRDTLEDLSDIILEVFEFDNDHMHAFFMDNKPYSNVDAYFCRYDEEEDRHTCDYYIGEVISDKKTFLYLFDFGDDWEFSCRVLKIEDKTCEEWGVIRSVGDPPEQYPCY